MITEKLKRSLHANESKLAFEYNYNVQMDGTLDPDKMNQEVLKKLEVVYKRIMMSLD